MLLIFGCDRENLTHASKDIIMGYYVLVLWLYNMQKTHLLMENNMHLNSFVLSWYNLNK